MPTLVKAYAVDFCGTQTLREASRDLVEPSSAHLADLGRERSDCLLCQLNTYAEPVEVKQ